MLIGSGPHKSWSNHQPEAFGLIKLWNGLPKAQEGAQKNSEGFRASTQCFANMNNFQSEYLVHI